MYEYKNLNYGYVIITPENDPKLVKITASSIKMKQSNASIICVTRHDIDSESEREIKNICACFKGQNTYTSLLTKGMENCPSEWNLYVISGTFFENKIQKKYSYFVESDKDILFPVVNRKINFVEGTLNGILMHRNALKNIGCFLESNSLEKSKTIWSYNAVCSGYRFKAIVGTKF